MKKFPGTVIEAHNQSGRMFLDGLFVAGNIMMNQICSLTGLGTPTLQNWINRGWLSRPKGKRYDENQVARILIINGLRSTMRLEDISSLLFFVNGETDDESDDIIDEAHLYYYICDVVLSDDFSILTLDEKISNALLNYKEVNVGDAKRVKKALEIISKVYLASNLLDETKAMLATITEDNIMENNG